MVRARRVKAEREAVAWMLRMARRPTLPCVVTLTRATPTARQLDDDNLRGAMKAVRDQVAEWIGVDDASPRVTWRYEQRRNATKAWQVWISFGAST